MNNRFLTASCALVLACCGQSTPYKMTDLDRQVLLRTDAQIQLIQQQFQAAVRPIAQEQQDTLKRVCESAKLIAGKDCHVDPQSGFVTKEGQPSPPLPAAPVPAKRK